MGPADHPPRGYEAADDGRVVVREQARARVSALGLDRLEAVFALPAEQRGRYKALARAADPAGGTVFVKRYDFSRPEVWLRTRAKANPARFSGPRELANLLALAEAGLRVPVPLAAGEEDRGVRRRSFVALAELPGVPLDSLPPPTTTAERRARIDAVARLLRALHTAGFWHRDLYCCNLFADPTLGLGLLDCERVDRRPGGPRLRWRVKDLAAVACSAPWPTPRERLRFLHTYLETTRLTPPDRRLARAVERKAERLLRRGKKGP